MARRGPRRGTQTSQSTRGRAPIQGQVIATRPASILTSAELLDNPLSGFTGAGGASQGGAGVPGAADATPGGARASEVPPDFQNPGPGPGPETSAEIARRQAADREAKQGNIALGLGPLIDDQIISLPADVWVYIDVPGMAIGWPLLEMSSIMTRLLYASESIPDNLDEAHRTDGGFVTMGHGGRWVLKSFAQDQALRVIDVRNPTLAGGIQSQFGGAAQVRSAGLSVTNGVTTTIVGANPYRQGIIVSAISDDMMVGGGSVAATQGAFLAAGTSREFSGRTNIRGAVKVHNLGGAPSFATFLEWRDDT